MFLVSEKTSDRIGILDTDDGVVDYFTPNELGRIVKKFGITIEGLSIEGHKIKCKPADIKTGFMSQFGDLDNRIEFPDFERKCGSALNTIIQIANRIAGKITGLTLDNIDLLDGYDCVGIDGNNLKDATGKYNVSIYANPEVSVIDTGVGSYDLVGVKINRYGIDLMEGNNPVKHIVCGRETWSEDLRKVGY